MDVDTKESCVIVPQNSDLREHLINSLESAAGEAQEQINKQRSVQKMMDSDHTVELAKAENILENRGVVKT